MPAAPDAGAWMIRPSFSSPATQPSSNPAMSQVLWAAGAVARSGGRSGPLTSRRPSVTGTGSRSGVRGLNSNHYGALQGRNKDEVLAGGSRAAAHGLAPVVQHATAPARSGAEHSQFAGPAGVPLVYELTSGRAGLGARTRTSEGLRTLRGSTPAAMLMGSS